MWARRHDGDSTLPDANSTLPLLVGHRGASAREVENTLAAFRRARAEGADGVELDVLVCRSGEVVVFHDDDLSRLAGRPERISELPLGALREVRLAGGEGIPTLEEALEVCGPGLRVNVELKVELREGEAAGRLVERVAEIVARMNAGGRVLVSSFNPWALHLWMKRAPRVPAGLLFERAAPLPLRRAWAATWLRPFALNPELTLCSRARVARWHRAGRFVMVWTVDAPADLRACREMGVDAVITNDPAAARAALGG